MRTITITEKDWKVLRDALEAQQHECTPSGETMVEVAEILEKMPR